MRIYYIAVTYEICEHNRVFEELNEYILDSQAGMAGQVRKLAKLDVAPMVRMYQSDTKDYTKISLYKEYRFKEYECSCKGSVV
ncbi:MAG TPA: hypothetical protein VEY51_08065 [Chondromyces sp.]|nr:hypothetical protein [Chondromyces sp.]